MELSRKNKMHLDVFIRGKVEFVNLWECHVQAQYFKLRRKNIKTKESSDVAVQMGLRKGVFGSYELIFPQEALADVLSMLGTFQEVSYSHLSSSKYRHFVMRVLFGDQRIPKQIFEQAKKLKQNILITDRERCLSDCLVKEVTPHLIGIKYDKFGSVDGIYEHELL